LIYWIYNRGVIVIEEILENLTVAVEELIKTYNNAENLLNVDIQVLPRPMTSS
jgi:hypothetical protein